MLAWITIVPICVEDPMYLMPRHSADNQRLAFPETFRHVHARQIRHSAARCNTRNSQHSRVEYFRAGKRYPPVPPCPPLLDPELKLIPWTLDPGPKHISPAAHRNSYAVFVHIN